MTKNNIKNRSPWDALFISILFPGLGQIYNGNLWLGLKFNAMGVILVLSYFFFLSHFFIGTCVACVIAVTLGIFIHANAFLTAKRQKTIELRKYNSVFFYISYLVLVLNIGIGLKLISPIKLYVYPSNSMIPSIVPGDRMTVKTYTKNLIVRGDIIFFKNVAGIPTTYGKRVIGVPGDTVKIITGNLVLNGQKVVTQDASLDRSVDVGVPEDSIVKSELLPGKSHQILVDPHYDNMEPITVEPNTYFVLSDKRDNNKDSRTLGLIPEENIIGKADYIFLSKNPEGWFRFSRMGNKL